MVSWNLILISEIDQNSSLPSTCVIFDYMDRILLNCIYISSDVTGSYESSFSTISIISIN